MSARKSGYFRRPKAQAERRWNVAATQEKAPGDKPIKGRYRKRLRRDVLPDDWEDLTPASRRDRSRGKHSHSPKRKAKTRLKWANAGGAKPKRSHKPPRS